MLAQTFINTLAGWQWAILLAIPPLIVALYFLKLRRQPVEVPSTYLWRKTIEEMHVNSLWQRLRRSLLLLLQLLLMALIIFAALRPGWRGEERSGNRFIFLIDTSASMTATDVAPSRFEVARRQIAERIDAMESGDAAMIISFSNEARTEQGYTTSRAALRRALEAIQPTSRTSNLQQALRYAAGWARAGPGRQAPGGQPGEDSDSAAEQVPVTVYIFSDGGYPAVESFTADNLSLRYVAVGRSDCRNVGIVAFTARRADTSGGDVACFARIQGFSGEGDQPVDLSLYLNGELFDAKTASVSAGKEVGVEFDVGPIESGTLRLEIDSPDDLAVDNVAYAAVNPPKKVRVLLVTPGNRRVESALATGRARHLADVEVASPAVLATDAYARTTTETVYDWIIFDRCAPAPAMMPQANTLFIGTQPPVDGWSAGEPTPVPVIIDVDPSHPLMQLISLDNVVIAEAQPLEVPPWGATLVEADFGPIVAIAARQGFEDVVLGFDIVRQDESGDSYVMTDWVRRVSFPTLFYNALEYFGGAGATGAAANVRPGEPITVRAAAPVEQVVVRTPRGEERTVPRRGRAGFVIGHAEQPGFYEVLAGKQAAGGAAPFQRFTVNLFDSQESDIRPRSHIGMGEKELAAESDVQSRRWEMWRYLLGAALVVLVLEWYIFNRRVYL